MAEEKQENTNQEEQGQTQEEQQTEDTQQETSQQEETSSEASEVEVPEKFQGIVEQIENMSVLDLSELVGILEKKFGVSAAAPAAAAPAAAAPAEGGEEEEEKTEFDVEISDPGSNKINVIKAVRSITDMGLKDAKELVDNTPSVVKEGVKKEDAEQMKGQLEEAGATVTLK